MAGDNLAKLLEGFRTAGLPLHYTHTGPSLPDDAAFQLTVYRIVQESLTNVLRYGRSLGRVDVAIVRGRVHGHHRRRRRRQGHRRRRRLRPRRRRAGSPAVGTGQGLAGMLERARIYAGTVEAGRSGDRGWRVHAVLHWNGGRKQGT